MIHVQSLLGCLALTLVLQGGEPAAPRPLLARMAEEALTRGQAHSMLTELCTRAPKRLSGSPGAAAAVAWAEARMRTIGFDEVRLEPCKVPRWERGSIERLTLTSSGAAVGERLSICALGGSPATPKGGIEAEVIEVQGLEQLAALGEAARGKAVFFNRPMDPTLADPFAAYGGAVDQRSRGAVAAAQAGAVFAIVRSMTLSLDDHPHTGSMRSAPEPCVPAAAISTLGAARLSDLLAREKSVRVRLELDCRFLPDVESFNVVGELRGASLPDEFVTVGGHLDAWDLAEGAHDNGAGCVQALEVARIWRALELRPRRSLRVVLWMNEENGSRGSLAFRDARAKTIDKQVFALETDRGGFAPRAFVANSTGASLDRLRELVAPLAAFGVRGVDHSTGVGADVAALAQLGVPCAGFVPEGSRYFDVHHSALDTLDSVHPRELELGALCLAWLCHAVADQEHNLERIPTAASGVKPH